MPHFLGYFDHFPGGRKNRFIALFLPELDVESPVRKFSDHKPRTPLW